MSAPLFILAPPRSFTSVMCGVIGSHPEMMALPEVNLFAGGTLEELGKWHGRRRRLKHGLLRAVAELGLGGQSEADIDAADTWLNERLSESTGQIYADLAAWAAPKRLVDKSPIYVLEDGALDRIDAAFPEAKFIHMTRHPHGTLKSMVELRNYISKAGGIAGRGGVDPETFWLQPHLRAKEFLDSLPASRWMRVRGEDLLSDPDLYLPQIAEWLGVSTAPEAIAAMKQPELSPFAGEGPANATYGNDPGYMSSPELRPYTAKPLRLDDPVPDGVTGPYSPVLRFYAELFGYE
ncbi:sulfotransferase family protein [Pseudoroseicyclus sp. H15]